MRKKTLLRLGCGLLAIMLIHIQAVQVHAENWPRFRGPR